MRMFVEFFVEDLARSRSFYVDVLGLQVERESEDIVVLRRDALQLHLLPIEDLPEALRGRERGAALGARVEFAIEVDDVESFEAHVRRAGAVVHEALQDRPWHRTDFRLLDPDGAYLRITSPVRGQEGRHG